MKRSFIQKSYRAGLIRNLQAGSINLDHDTIKRIIFYGIKFLNSSHYEFNPLTIEARFQLCETVLSAINRLTPRQLMNLFPVDKIYSGGRDSDWKNYFTTMDVITEYGLDTQITEPFGFLWDYTNGETRVFLVHFMSVINDMRQLKGDRDMIAEFFGLHPIDNQEN